MLFLAYQKRERLFFYEGGDGGGGEGREAGRNKLVNTFEAVLKKSLLKQPKVNQYGEEQL